MSVKLYMDVHVPRAVTNQLRLHGIDVLTAQEDGTAELDDAPLLDRATQLGHVLYSQDEDLLACAHEYQQRQHPLCGGHLCPPIEDHHWAGYCGSVDHRGGGRTC